ncbi:glycosyltransferase 87 family protein [Butyrivibrio sp. AE3004]|uniref:glycosyltransferase 87 family protein n=1 Tax=Butyrivibrio sp. AE3004 TaxID=1506994 RepID=UPI000493FA53|nr:glycosyltransferase 87 family protein [Butyrivibrio sp. AE3004]
MTSGKINNNTEKNTTQITGLDKWLIGFVTGNLERIAFFALVFIAILIRIMLMPETELSPDYNSYYLPWVNAYREYGFFGGLSKDIGDYYVPYNVMYAICSLLPCEPYIPIALFSLAAELVSAYFIKKILFLILVENGTDEKTAARRAAFAAALTLFLPFVVLNGALWKQCDAIYVVFLVISVYCLLKENYRIAFVFLAIAFGFKLQAIFFVPLFLVIYFIKKKYSILEFFWIPVMYLILGLPCVLCKRGLKATYLAYLSQTKEVSTEGYGMVSFYPNFYNFGLDSFDSILTSPAVLFAVVVLGILAVYALSHVAFFNKKENTLYFGIFMAWTCCMFLPGMHERYDYAIVLLMTALCLSVCRDKLWIACIMNINSFLVYITVLFRQEVFPITVLSALQIAVYAFSAFDLVKRMGGECE